MATFNVFISETKVYQTTVEAADLQAALIAGAELSTTGLTPSEDRTITARTAEE